MNIELLKKLDPICDKKLLIITDDYNSSKVKEYLSKKDQIIDYKLLNKEELTDLLLFHYDKSLQVQERIHLLTTNGIDYELAKVLEKSLIDVFNMPTLELFEDKKRLLYKPLELLKQYITKNDDEFVLFTFQDATVVLAVEEMDYHYALIYNRIKELKLNIINLDSTTKPLTHAKVIECNTPQEEVKYVIKDLCTKLLENKNLEDYRIVYTDTSYLPLLEMSLRLHKIPFTLLDTASLYSTDYVKKFIKELSNIPFDNQNYYELFKEILKENTDYEYFDSLIKVLNNYTKLNHNKTYLKCLVDDLKNTSIKTKATIGILLTSDLHDLKENGINYVIGAYNKKVPEYKEMKGFIDSTELEKAIGFSIYEYNDSVTRSFLNICNSSASIVMTYAKTLNGYSTVVSSIINKEIVEKYVEDYDQIYSMEDAYLSYTSALDDFYMYDYLGKALGLKNIFKENNYKTYDHSFKGTSDFFKENNKKHISLSYTSFNLYNECPFKYYISKHFRSKSDSSFEIFIGNLCHKVLEQLENENQEEEGLREKIHLLVREYYDSYPDLEIKNKLNEFYLANYEEWLEIVYKNNLHFSDMSMFKKEALEKEFNINKEIEKVPCVINGKIDKIMKYENAYYVVDYKTGNTKVSPSLWEYGAGMQLPIYLYLLRQENKNIRLAGAYLQHLLPDAPFKKKNNATYLDQIDDHLKLTGIFPQDDKLVQEINASVAGNKYLDYKLEKTNKTAFNEKELNKIIELTDSELSKTLSNIIHSNFDISPIYNKEKDGCSYCMYEGICYHTQKDRRNIELDSDLSFIRGGSDE